MREGQLQPWSKTPRWGRVGVGVDQQRGGMQEDYGKGWGQGMGVGCWLRQVVVGARWLGVTQMAVGRVGGREGTPDSLDTCLSREAAWVRRASWPCLWPTLHL